MTAPSLEVERKLLLQRVPDAAWETEQRLRQGYLAIDGETEVRIRADILTIKHGSGLTRIEEELQLDPVRAEVLWDLTRGRRVEKIRRTLTDGDLVFEVDEYTGDLTGLVVAEVEFPDEEAAHAFVLPAWLGDDARDVTGDKRYANRAQATDGRPADA